MRTTRAIEYPPIPPIGPPPEKFYRFVLTWNSSKVSKGVRPQHRFEWQQCQGIMFSDPNVLFKIYLSSGLHFESMADLKHILDISGDYRVDWLDGEDW